MSLNQTAHHILKKRNRFNLPQYPINRIEKRELLLHP